MCVMSNLQNLQKAMLLERHFITVEQNVFVYDCQLSLFIVVVDIASLHQT